MKKQQIVFIHGGETFENYDDYLDTLKSWEFSLPENTKRWSKELANELEDNFEVIYPTMPCKYNAKYLEWKIWFEKILEFSNPETIFIGHSLGGTFLLKYFSEEKNTPDFKKIFLVAAAITPETEDYSLATFKLSFEKIKKLNSEKFFIIHSEDDFVVPFKDAEKLKELLPEAQTLFFEDRGHFLQEDFPEIVNLVKRI